MQDKPTITLSQFQFGEGTQVIFSLRVLEKICGGPEQMWESYFEGRLDPEVSQYFEAAINPQTRMAAWLMRAQLNEIRALIKELKHG